MTKNQAIKLAIRALECIQRRYAPGHYIYLNGGQFDFAAKDHRKYIEIEQAKEIIGGK